MITFDFDDWGGMTFSISSLDKRRRLMKKRNFLILPGGFDSKAIVKNGKCPPLPPRPVIHAEGIGALCDFQLVIKFPYMRGDRQAVRSDSHGGIHPVPGNQGIS